MHMGAEGNVNTVLQEEWLVYLQAGKGFVSERQHWQRMRI